MSRNLKYKAAFIAAVILLCFYGLVGLPKSLEEARSNFRQNIKLGLDLRGGSHLVLQVQVQDAFKAEADLVIDRLKEDLAKANIGVQAIERNDPASMDEADSIQVNIRGVPLDNTGAFRTLIAERFPQWVLTPVSSTDYRLNIRQSEALALRRDTVERAIRTIENRINGLGLTEATVQQRGRSDAESEILVQMPGVDDPARVKAILQTAAVLELVEVKDGPFSGREQALAKHGGVLPLNTRLVRERPRPGETGETWYLLARGAVITGRDVRNARPSRDEFNRWETDFTLSQDAAKRFGRFTEANVGNRLAVVLDGQIRTAPTIQSRIDDSGRISGAASEQDAADLAVVLKAGSLPAKIVYLEERTVGPSLGADSIRDGFIAGLIGLTAVIGVMLFFYRNSGVNAVLALVLNAVILLAALSYFGAVLTLPGIAGVILTIGMAVDSNVLVFERIKEELASGKAIPAAVDVGFNRAFLTIIDTHVTTVVSCAFLFIFGSGPVKGFAVTLVIGLIANVFTAVFVSKTIFEWSLFRKPRMAQLSI
ncbi:MAG: protein translocase subunit SecD [Bryobacteraceae bacterium]|nr:protein translocase subunit SecD [Bryobacteraceae bacterium]